MKPIKQLKKKIGVGVLVLVAIAVLGAGGYYVWLTTPPPMPTTVSEAGNLLVSERYLRLPESRRYDYMQRAMQLYEKASAAEKKEMKDQFRKVKKNKDLISQVVEDRINAEIRNYIMADDFDRRAIIDRAIGLQMIAEAKRAKRPAKALTPERKAHIEQRKDAFIQMVEKRLETGNPQQQSYVGEFVKAMMARRAQMGLDPLPVNPDK